MALGEAVLLAVLAVAAAQLEAVEAVQDVMVLAAPAQDLAAAAVLVGALAVDREPLAVFVLSGRAVLAHSHQQMPIAVNLTTHLNFWK
jgi:methylthioribose-1-phosphate isomerase